MHLTDRASLLRAMFRLLDTDAGDTAMTEHDLSGRMLEGLVLHIQQGAEDAQSYMIGAGSSWWNETSGALVFEIRPSGLQRAALEDGFRRLFALPEHSALHDGAGQQWGVEVDPELKHRSPSGEGYYIEGRYLWLVRSAAPPDGLVMDYIRRVADVDDGEDADFPEEDRTLIVAFAAMHARHDAWYVGGPQGDANIERNLQTKKRQAFRRARRTSTPRRVGVPVVSPHWALAGGGR